MTIQEAIKKAIEGGYSLTGDKRWDGERIHSIKKFGSRWMSWVLPKIARGDDEIYFWRDEVTEIQFKEETLLVSGNDLWLDPLFWKSLGTGLGWYAGEYSERAVDFMECVVTEGKTAKSFFAELQ
jgi:hypothetical protein